jgi:galactokinase
MSWTERKSLPDAQGEPAGSLLERLERREPRIADALSRIYPCSDGSALREQFVRYRKALGCFVEAYGPEREVAILRAPGRLNLLEYLDMVHGPHLSAALDLDLIMVVSTSKGEDLEVVHCNSSEFPPRRLSPIKDFSLLRQKASGMTWAQAAQAYPYAGRERGDYANYLLAPLLRLMWSEASSSPTGMQWALGPSTLPMRAGLSSSSALVVLSYMGAMWCNPQWPAKDLHETAQMLGEAEWYVGTRGGANDHMTILLNPAGGVLVNHHEMSPPVAEPLPFLDGVEILLVNTLWEADKAMRAMAAFNARKGEMDLAAALMRKSYPLLSERLVHLGSLDPVILGMTAREIEQLVEDLPENITADKAEEALGIDAAEIMRRFPGISGHLYMLRRRARFFYKELLLGSRIKEILLQSLGTETGSHAHDELLSAFGETINEAQRLLKEELEVSCPGIDDLIEILAGIPGVLGAKLTGAGFGGCVVAFCRKQQAEHIAKEIKRRYFVPERFEPYRQQIASTLNPGVRVALMKHLEEGLAHPERSIIRVRFACGAGRVEL